MIRRGRRGYDGYNSYGYGGRNRSGGLFGRRRNQNYGDYNSYGYSSRDRGGGLFGRRRGRNYDGYGGYDSYGYGSRDYGGGLLGRWRGRSDDGCGGDYGSRGYSYEQEDAYTEEPLIVKLFSLFKRKNRKQEEDADTDVSDDTLEFQGFEYDNAVPKGIYYSIEDPDNDVLEFGESAAENATSDASDSLFDSDVEIHDEFGG